MKYTELINQKYGGNNCTYSAGFVEGYENPEDTMYIKLERDGDEPTIIYLRPDEMAAIAWISNGVLWSHLDVLYRESKL